jgi:hypothetical protein
MELSILKYLERNRDGLVPINLNTLIKPIENPLDTTKPHMLLYELEIKGFIKTENEENSYIKPNGDKVYISTNWRAYITQDGIDYLKDRRRKRNAAIFPSIAIFISAAGVALSLLTYFNVLSKDKRTQEQELQNTRKHKSQDSLQQIQGNEIRILRQSKISPGDSPSVIPIKN